MRFCISFLLFSMLAAGQVAVFRTDVGEVLVQASVLDKKGRSITGLPPSAFTVYENGVPQTVDSFTHDDAPVSVGILVDNSASMRSIRIQLDEAALNFVRASNPLDQVFIVKFNDLYHMVAPFTNSISELEKGLGEIDPQAGTALNDAIMHAATYVKTGKRAKKVLVVITDGFDNASSHSLEQTLRILQEETAPVIYCIGLHDDDADAATRRAGMKALIAIANETGGAAYFPKNLKEVDSTTRKVAQDIRLQYNLVYRSNQPAPGYHAIRVEVNDPKHKNLTAYTRRGYYRDGATH